MKLINYTLTSYEYFIPDFSPLKKIIEINIFEFFYLIQYVSGSCLCPLFGKLVFYRFLKEKTRN